MSELIAIIVLSICLLGQGYILVLLVRELRLTKALTTQTPQAYLQSRMLQKPPAPNPPHVGKPPEKPNVTPRHRRLFQSIDGEYKERVENDTAPIA